MRWLYAEPGERSAERQKVLAKIDAWWKAFERQSPKLNALFQGESEWDLPEWMHKTLQQIDERLMWEFGPGVKGGHRLVITPESERGLRPLVGVILSRAPQLPGWEFYAYRLAEEGEDAARTVEGRTGGDLRPVEAAASLNELNRIDLKFRSPKFASADDHDALNVAFVATETLLGEQVLDQWVGAIEVAAKPRGLKKLLGGRHDAGFFPVARLAPTVHSLIDAARQQLPDRPRYELDLLCRDSLKPSEEQPTWAAFKMEPEQQDDYPGWADLLAASASNEKLWTAEHSGSFHSCRFSRCDETFCYLKIDGTQWVETERFPDRTTMEEALDEALCKRKAGCVTSGGTGLRYSYIDLALVDVGRATEVIRKALAGGRVPQRTWLLFFDAHLGEEWIGLYSDTPAPPSEPHD